MIIRAVHANDSYLRDELNEFRETCEKYRCKIRKDIIVIA